MKKNKSKLILIALVILFCAAAALLYPVLSRKMLGTAPVQTPTVQTSMTRYTVGRGNIQKTAVGNGNLSYGESRRKTLPFAVKVEDVLVKKGEKVTAGQAVLKVNMDSLLETITELEAKLTGEQNALSKLASAYADEKELAAGFSGRVKSLYVQKGDLVQGQAFTATGLCLLSLDGKMFVEVSGKNLSTGDKLTVVENKTSYPAVVNRVEGEKAVVTFSDEKILPGAKVSVYQNEALVLDAEAQVHMPYPVQTLLQGSIKEITVGINQAVSARTTLFKVAQVERSAEYAVQLQKLERASAQLSEAKQLYAQGVVAAETDGVVQNTCAASDIAENTELFALFLGQANQMTVGIDELSMPEISVG